MADESLPVGELLVKLCELSRSHNVSISIKQNPVIPNAFELRLDRLNHHHASQIDITKTFINDPQQVAEYTFRRSLYEIKRLDNDKKENKE